MRDYTYYRDSLSEFGIVERVIHPVVTASGLPLGKPQEMVVSEGGQIGQIVSLHEEHARILMFSAKPVFQGEKLARTNKTLTVPVGESLLGHVITPLGAPFAKSESQEKAEEEREIDINPLGIHARSRIHKPFITGTAIVDMMVPLGKGQKELIIGDRKTGKSSFLLTCMKAQIKEGAVVIYAAIGKRKSAIKHLLQLIIEKEQRERVVIVASGSDDSQSLIFLTPFTAMTIAEYFRDKGEDVLVILDDLSVHAKSYRELSLLSENFPGRDSYPGDIFSTHARLLERAGNFLHKEKGDVSITCLPVGETVEGDIAGFIPTNLMGITDGHLFFDSNIFYRGRRPAVNTLLSVSRVGKQTQKPYKRELTRELNAFFALYEKMQTLSHFGSELKQEVKDILAKGDNLLTFFEQDYRVIIPEDIQVIVFCLIWLGFVGGIKQQLISLEYDLNEQKQNKDVVQVFAEILEAQSFGELLHNVTSNKDKILNLWKSKNNS